MSATQHLIEQPTVDPAGFRGVMASYPTGITIITAQTPGGPVGMTANSFTSVSLDPPVVLFCAALTSTTWPRIESVGSFVVNFMSERGAALVQQFASSGVDRFTGVQHAPGETGNPILASADAHLECVQTSVHLIGDHAVVLATVVGVGGEAADAPLVFHRRQLRAIPDPS